ncbi:hypothetical protein RHGRI_035924 [Rhododendron griersonianum]|uniref:Uncharacterized protein n=1 Tax=Rhododendron griersonianum TaxID=479676 RepID=A0AAV6HNZ6_9ERIC|nr:hypothetical protein RHGRI_035924 [Rhododendron griersonianum]
MSASGVVVHAERPYHVDEPGEVLQQLQLQSIASSSEIRDALKDEELQKLICNIDCSPDAVNIIEETQIGCVNVFRKSTKQWNLTYSGYLPTSRTRQGSFELLALLLFLRFYPPLVHISELL